METYAQKLTAASTCACSARVVNLSMVAAISPMHRDQIQLVGRSVVRRHTFELTVDDSQILEDDAIFERCLMHIVHSARSQGVKESG
jgi:hypothetical protein